MSEIRKWLEAIGVDQYGDAFEANHIDVDLLPGISQRTPPRSSEAGEAELLTSF